MTPTHSTNHVFFDKMCRILTQLASHLEVNAITTAPPSQSFLFDLLAAADYAEVEGEVELHQLLAKLVDRTEACMLSRSPPPLDLMCDLLTAADVAGTHSKPSR